MNDTEEKISYRLFKKGRENYNDFDRLLTGSNELIKERVDRLSVVNSDLAQKISKRAEEKTALRKGREARKRLFFKIMSFPAAAAFLFFFIFINKIITGPVSMGGSVYLFVSPAGEPDTFYSTGTQFSGGEEVTLAFQPDAEVDGIRQGFLFSIDNHLESKVYYRYNSTSGPLVENNPTVIEKVIRLESDIDYIYFFIILSGDPFSEEEQIEKIKQMIRAKQLRSDSILKQELKNKTASYIYLMREDKK